MMIDKLRHGGGRAFREAERAVPPDAQRAYADLESNAGYDAQSDLALPTEERQAADGFAPFAGSIVPPPEAAGYDVQRDTGIDVEEPEPKRRWRRSGRRRA